MEATKRQAPWDGMFPQHSCKGCGRPLNEDGNHHAELYAGTYTGLCYACERKGPCVVREYYDGCKLVSHPPDQPSYRRDRNEHHWYPDCKRCHMGTVRESRGYVPGLAVGGSYRSYCPDCLRRHCAWSEERRQRKLRGQTPFEELAARYQAESLSCEQEAGKRTTKSRTKERRAHLAAVALDYQRLAETVLASVLQDGEEHLPDIVDDRVEKARQRIAANPGSIPFPDERLAILQQAAYALRQALPAQCACKRRQTRVLV